MNGATVTVTITNWNGRHYLEDCIAAVLAQTVRPARIILVDNASEDGSVEFVSERFPSVEILRLGRNDGPCPARNAGLEAATTDLVLSIDNDAMLTPDCLERLLPHMLPEVAVVEPRSLFDADRTRIHYDGASMHYVGMMLLRNFYAEAASAGDDLLDVQAAISVALLLDRRKVLEAGAYDPAHFILFEDHDLSYRLRARGHRIVHEPKAIVHHREGTAGISFRKQNTYSDRRVYLHSRNRWIVLLKCHQWRTLLLSTPALLAYEAAYVFFAAKNGSIGAWLRAKWHLVKLLPTLLRQRRIVQSSRRIADRELLTAAPLTISPLIKRRGLVARLQSAMERGFVLWWRLVRPLL